jgi:hypothetical protein
MVSEDFFQDLLHPRRCEKAADCSAQKWPKERGFDEPSTSHQVPARNSERRGDTFEAV